MPQYIPFCIFHTISYLSVEFIFISDQKEEVTEDCAIIFATLTSLTSSSQVISSWMGWSTLGGQNSICRPGNIPKESKALLVNCRQLTSFGPFSFRSNSIRSSSPLLVNWCNANAKLTHQSDASCLFYYFFTSLLCATLNSVLSRHQGICESCIQTNVFLLELFGSGQMRLILSKIWL